jgi:hypothetical protein
MPRRPLFNLAGPTGLIGLFAAVAVAGLATPVAAQRLQSVSAAPQPAVAGKEVAITVVSDISGGLNCNLRAVFGDGTTTEFKINQAKDAQYVLRHTYLQSGQFTVLIEPRTALPVMRCLGDAQRLQLTVNPAR